MFYDGPVISCENAKALGQKRFFTGLPCLHGHVDQRFTASGQCRQCMFVSMALRRDETREYDKNWRRGDRIKNPEKYRAAHRDYASKNKDKIKEQRRLRRIENSEKVKKNRLGKDIILPVAKISAGTRALSRIIR